MNLYTKLAEKRNDSAELQSCVFKTVDNLEIFHTTSENPGMLLGKIQSGKTKAYIGIIAASFDKGFDIAIVLQKNVSALTTQTYKRLDVDFEEFIDDDVISVYDIMVDFPENLSEWHLKLKMVIVAKKEDKNLMKLFELFNKYPILKEKKILIIDDEADFASISFYKQEGIVFSGKIQTRIDSLRNINKDVHFLQVTATPYSLYLQSDCNEESSKLFKPKKPAFTVLVPVHKDYIGGDYYYLESEEQESPAYYIFNEISQREIEILKLEDRRRFKLEKILENKDTLTLRSAIVNFIVGASIRRLQQIHNHSRLKKYSFVVHTEIKKDSHEWQFQIIKNLSDDLKDSINKNPTIFENLINESYDNLFKSLNLGNDYYKPSNEEVINYVTSNLSATHINKINSDQDLERFLDKKGQLKLQTPFNIFVGGQILDRGITIDNLIGFYYGRNPKRTQQDTVLQHSRMYGYRDKDDLLVTRFYSTRSIYNNMKIINEFDSELRKVIENNDNIENRGVYFIRKDTHNNIIPCSPNKLLLSKITTLRQHKRLLPIGFQTDYKTKIGSIITKLDDLINSLGVSGQPKLIKIDIVKEIIKMISLTLVFEDENYNWDVKSLLAVLDYLTSLNSISTNDRKIYVVANKDRNIKRIKEDGGYSDSPDTPKTDGKLAKEYAIDTPIFMLFRQNGQKELGWRDCPFWWPVLYAQNNVKTTIFASEVIENKNEL